MVGRVTVDHVSAALPATADGSVGIASFPPAIRQNPYQRLLYDGLRRHGFRLVAGNRLKLGWLIRNRGRVKVLHFHWLESYYRHDRGSPRVRRLLSPVRLLLLGLRLVAAKALGYRVIWTVHQVTPHEAVTPVLDRTAARLVARMADVLIAHDPETADAASVLGARAAQRVHVVPHGSYIGVYPEGRARTAVRAELDIPEDAFLFLTFGHLRGYKELHLLLEAFARTRETLPGAKLLVAGMALDETSARAVDRARRDGRLRSIVEFVPDERVAELHAAADVAVLPRGDGGTSGSLVLALSLGTPVIAADRAGYRRLTGDGAAGWLFTPGDPAALADALETAAGAARSDLEHRGAAALAAAAELRWAEACAATALLASGGRT